MKLRSGLAYVGARTTRARNARGDGLNVYRIGPDGDWSHLQLLEMENPSFLAFDRSGQFLYTVHGDSDGIVPLEVSGQRTAEQVAGAELHVVEGGPHGINDSHTEEFNRVLLAVLAR